MTSKLSQMKADCVRFEAIYKDAVRVYQLNKCFETRFKALTATENYIAALSLYKRELAKIDRHYPKWYCDAINNL